MQAPIDINFKRFEFLYGISWVVMVIDPYFWKNNYLDDAFLSPSFSTGGRYFFAFLNVFLLIVVLLLLFFVVFLVARFAGRKNNKIVISLLVGFEAVSFFDFFYSVGSDAYIVQDLVQQFFVVGSFWFLYKAGGFRWVKLRRGG